MLKKIIFMGTPIFAVHILKSLYQNGYPVSVVYSQPPKKSSRGMKTHKSPVHLMAETLNIEARTPDTLKGNSIEESFLKNLDADLAIVVAYGKILPESFSDIVSKLSCFLISISYLLHTGPESSFLLIFITLIPVFLSKLIIALCIGAAPLQLGKIDA